MKLASCISALLLLTCGFGAAGQGRPLALPFPAPGKAITLVVPFPAGGAMDGVGRVVADKLATVLDTQVVVENRLGSGGTVGAADVAAAAPDGYTLLLGSTATNTAAPAIYSRLSYDPEKALVPVAQVSNSENVLIVGSQIRATTVPALIAELRAKGPTAVYGSAGSGTITHLAAALFARTAGLTMVHKPYEGGVAVINALTRGEIDMAILNVTLTVPSIKSGRLHVIATTGAQRSRVYPQLPTVREAGLNAFEINTWAGIFAPARTPAPVIDHLTRAIAEAMQDPALQRTLRIQGDQAAYREPKAFGVFLKDEAALWQPFIRQAHLSVD